MFNKPMNLNDILGNHVPLQNAAGKPDVFGVEVELEGSNINDPPIAVMEYWTHHNDNSLRKLNPGDQAIEYVFRQPYDLTNTKAAIGLLFDFLTSKGVKVYDSYRTSIHVHINFGMETFRTIYNFMTLSLILDELLTSQNGDHRIGNNFCLRAKDALGQVISLIQSIEGGDNFFNIVALERYSSINFASLMKFGSIEFRSLECTTHEGRLMHWINTLARIKEKSKAFKNPVEIIALFSVMGPDQFLKSVLGPFSLKYLAVDGYADMLNNGMRIAQDLAYCSAWKEYEPKPSPKDTGAAEYIAFAKAQAKKVKVEW